MECNGIIWNNWIIPPFPMTSFHHSGITHNYIEIGNYIISPFPDSTFGNWACKEAEKIKGIEESGKTDLILYILLGRYCRKMREFHRKLRHLGQQPSR